MDYHAVLARLRRNKPAIFPTETFYGLGCAVRLHDAGSTACCRAAAVAKARSTGNPLPLLLGDAAMLTQLAERELLPEEVELTRRFWPGPLTLVLPAREGLPPSVLGMPEEPGGRVCQGSPFTVAVRVTSHPLAARLSMDLEAPLAATSANLSGLPPATTPSELDPELVRRVQGYVLTEAPLPAGGLPSTILRHTADGVFALLRPGAISPTALQTADVKFFEPSTAASQA